MVLRKGEPPMQIPHNWPKWPGKCRSHSWRTGLPCRQRCIRGADLCRKHGGAGLNRIQGWKRYLLWLMLPDTVRYTHVVSPVTDEMVTVLCRALADAALEGDERMSASARLQAVEYLFQTQMVDTHPDPAILLTHLSREDAVMAVKVLRLNRLMY